MLAATTKSFLKMLLGAKSSLKLNLGLNRSPVRNILTYTSSLWRDSDSLRFNEFTSGAKLTPSAVYTASKFILALYGSPVQEILLSPPLLILKGFLGNSGWKL